MNELLRTQKEEANAAFTKFIRKHYETWVQHPDAEDTPLLSPKVMRQTVLPKLKEGKRVVWVVLDNFRYDQWRTLAKALANDFDIEENLYYSILPTVTQYARNALFSGLMPLDIKTQYPDLWVDEEEDEGKNLHEEELIRKQLERLRQPTAFSYHKTQ